MTPDVCETRQMHGFDGVGLPACRELGSGRPLAYNDAIDAAGTCTAPSVRWSGWAIFDEDGDLDYYAYATDEEAALGIARDAGCEGDLSAVEDGDGVGTCQEVA